MGTESNPGQPNERATPPGWRRVRTHEELDLLTVDRNHPEFPSEWLARQEQEAHKRLGEDPQVATAVERLRALFLSRAHVFIDESRKAEHARSRRDVRGWAEAFVRIEREAPTFVDDLVTAATEEAVLSCPRDIAISTRVAYLIDQALPPEIRSPVIEGMGSPFTLLVNRGTNIARIAVFPGEILIRFSGMPVRNLGAVLAKLVTEAQKILKHDAHKSRGGRLGLDQAPDTAVQTAQVKAMKAAGKTKAQIAQALGMVGEGETEHEERVLRRVDRRLKAARRGGERGT